MRRLVGGWRGSAPDLITTGHQAVGTRQCSGSQSSTEGGEKALRACEVLTAAAQAVV